MIIAFMGKCVLTRERRGGTAHLAEESQKTNQRVTPEQFGRMKKILSRQVNQE